MSEEQRKHPRMPLDVEINFSSNAIARSKNISESGICLIHEQELEINKMQTFSFFLPDTNERIKTLARIKWTRKVSAHLYESGLEFWDAGEHDLEKIRNFLG